MKISNKRKGIGIIGGNDENKISYCPRCLKNGFQEVLGARIYLPDEPYREGDEENFRQCRACGTIVPIYETKVESKIRDKVDTDNNPFDHGSSIVGLGNKKKRNPRERETQKLLERIDLEPEEDIKAALRRGCTVVDLSEGSEQDLRYISDMQPERKRDLRNLEEFD